ncbi:hypothetical protein J3Q64DRAFT_1821864 [Phycomyces blakesleeanus]|uniref:F-box domain-containing protein n=1 Tax=Phycomyces blakesleeanus TaxID=4837 RepID=A0ABR3AXZ3_PHYBL
MDVSGNPENTMYEYFDSMHNNLKNLSSISVRINPDYDFLPTLDTIPNMAPVSFVTSLNINWDQHSNGSRRRNNWDPLWLYYFGYKYPNLRSLRLNAMTIWPRRLIIDKNETMLSLFKYNPNAFQHLETFVLTHDKHFAISFFALLKVFRELRYPLRHLTLGATQLGDIHASFSIDINRILQFFSETLQSFSIKDFKYIFGDQDQTFKLSSYHLLLTNLCISSIDLVFDVGNILDRCVTLKELELCGKELLIIPNTTAENLKQQQHRLRTLTLGGSVASEVFNYLSLRCKSLKQMTLDTLHINGSICKRTGCLLLNMPHTFLKTLNIGQLRYGPSYEETNLYDHSRLTLLSQLNDVSLTDEKIKRSGADLAFRYYRTFQSKKSLENIKQQCLYDEEIGYMDWEFELHKGYGQFRFGKIESIHVICPAYGIQIQKKGYEPSPF